MHYTLPHTCNARLHTSVSGLQGLGLSTYRCVPWQAISNTAHRPHTRSTRRTCITTPQHAGSCEEDNTTRRPHAPCTHTATLWHHSHGRHDTSQVGRTPPHHHLLRPDLTLPLPAAAAAADTFIHSFIQTVWMVRTAPAARSSSSSDRCCC
jgi:hypothetical protein